MATRTNSTDMPTSPAGEGAEPAPAAAALPPQAVLGLHGAFAVFDAAQDDWSEYIERLKHYFTANGPSTYRLIRSLVSPGKVTELSLGEIVGKARAHFNPKPSPIVKRYEFNTRRQAGGESINTYVDALCCIQRRLLQQTDLTFDKALEVALAAEAAEKDSKRLTDANPDKDLPNQIGKVRDLPPPSQPSNPKWGKPPQWQGGVPQQLTATSAGKGECCRCGGKHELTRCRFRQYDCNHCKKKGHLARMCRKRGQQQQQQTDQQKTHHVAEAEVSTTDPNSSQT